MSLTVRTVFTTLFFVILTMFAIAAWLVLFYPSSGHIISSSLEDKERTAHFQVTTERAELQKVINKYLRENVQTDGLSFAVTLYNDLQFQGDVRIFGLKVPVSVAFDPILQPNGDLVLEQRYFQVGALSIPASIVLEYIHRSYTFPDWIALQPVQKKIYLATTNMGLDSGLQIHVQKFDLNKDELKFDVYLPGEAP